MLSHTESGEFIHFYEELETKGLTMEHSELYSSVKEIASNVQVQQIELIYFRSLFRYLLAIYSLIVFLFVVHVVYTKAFRNKKIRIAFDHYTVDLKVTFSCKVPTCLS